MSVVFYDPKPVRNEYFTLMYLNDLCRLYREEHIEIGEINDLWSVENLVVITLGDHLTPELIVRIKENNNFLVVFDINDNSALTHTYGSSDEALLIDLIFKVSGIQKTKDSYETWIDNDLNYTRKKVVFQGGNWGKYFDLVDAGKIRSLPYPLWDTNKVDNIPWENRHKLALVRGGHHYYRVHLFLHLLLLGFVDGSSVFPASEYRNQFCTDCQKAFNEEGWVSFEYVKNHPEMLCRLKNWEYDFNVNGGHWNNSCIPRYYDLASLFHAKHGGFDLGSVEQAFKGAFDNTAWKNEIMNRYILYADCKWIFSIYAPPRFWEAAEAHIINLVPERMNDQSFFPELKEGVHYITYKEDFSNLWEVCSIGKAKFEYITQNCYELYDEYIVGRDGYRTSKNLLSWILQQIEEVYGLR